MKNFNICIASILLILSAEPVLADAVSFKEWQGSIGYSFEQQHNNGNLKRETQSLTLDLNNQYYVWQPWFVTGSITLNFSERINSSPDSQSHNIGGSVQANILPVSRYPMTLMYNKRSMQSDYAYSNLLTSSASSYYNSTDFESFSIVQKYLSKRLDLTGSFRTEEYSAQGSRTYGVDTTKFNMVRRDPHSDLTINAQLRSEKRNDSEAQSTNELVSLSHNYYPSDRINVSSYGSRVDDESVVFNATTSSYDINTTNIGQFINSINWRSLDNKTRVNTSVRATEIDSRTNDKVSNESLHLGAGVRHHITDNLYASLSAGNTTTTSSTSAMADETKEEVENIDAGIRYTSENIKLQEFDYKWDVGAGYKYKKTSGVVSNTSNINLAHSLSRSYMVSRKGKVNISGQQGYRYNDNDLSPDYGYLDHSIHINYRNNRGSGADYASARYTNNSEILQNHSERNHLDVQFSRNKKLTRNSTFTGSLNHQTSQTRYDTTTTDYTSNSALVKLALIKDIMYQRFVVNAALKFTTRTIDNRGDTSVTSFSSSLNHTIGKTHSSLTYRFDNIDNQEYSLIMLNIRRNL